MQTLIFKDGATARSSCTEQGPVISIPGQATQERKYVCVCVCVCVCFPDGSEGEESACNVGNWVQSLGLKDRLLK